MKAIVAALPKPANSPNPHIRIESTSSKASFIVQIECDCPTFRMLHSLVDNGDKQIR